MPMDRAPRPLGTMVALGFPRVDARADLAIASRLGASCVEVLPDWRSLPDPRAFRALAQDHGVSVHSAHGGWGRRAIRAESIDLGATDAATRLASVDDIRLALDWLAEAGGRCLVVHPGGYSEPHEGDARRDALIESLRDVADHALGLGLTACVENMPPGVHPGSRMAELAAIADALDHPGLALALDTGHAALGPGLIAETRDAGHRLGTTHVHDNDGRHDLHLPPGRGVVDWSGWPAALDAIGYEGPIMLECIRHLRDHPESLDGPLLRRLGELSRRG